MKIRNLFQIFLAVMMLAMFAPATQAQAQETGTQYTIKFVDQDGKVLQSSKWSYGDTPLYKGETPTKAADVDYTYTFSGWLPPISSVTCDATYSVCFTAKRIISTGGGSNEGGTGDGTNPSQGEGTGGGEGTGTGTSPVNPGTGTDTPVNPGTGTVPPAETGTKITYENGTVTTDKMSAAEGETVTLTVTPDDGYHLASLYLVGDNGMVYFPTQSTTDPSKYTVILFQVNAFTTLRVHATFEKDNDNPSQGSGTGGGSGDANTFSITVTADPAEGGTVTGGSSGSYAKDTQLEFKETPNEGYRFKNWTIDGIPGGLEDTYPFIVDGNFSTVVAHFERVYTLSGSNVFFFPEGSYDPITEAAEGETVVVSANPEKIPNGKYLSGYTAPKGVTLTMGEYDATFTMPAMDVTVDPVYTDQEEYTVDLTTSTSAAVPDMVFFMLQRLGSDSQYLDLNGDGTNDLELTVNQDFTTFYVTKLKGCIGGEFHVALPVATGENAMYNSVFFKLGNEVGGEAKDIKTLTITLSGTEFTYTGQPIEPTVTVKDGNTSVAVTLEYSKNRDAGEATVTVTANAAGYTGSVIKTFTINPKPVTVTANDATKFEGDPDSELTATIDGIVKADEDKKDLITYTIKRAVGEEYGKYPITVSGAKIQGNYTITFVGAEFTIIPVPASVPVLDESNPFVVSEEEGGAAAGTYYALEESLARSFIKSIKKSAARLMFQAGTTVKTKNVNGKRKITINLSRKEVGQINAGKVKVKAFIKSLPKGATVKIIVNKKVSTSRYKKLVNQLRKAGFKGKIKKKSRAAEGDDVDEDEIESGVEYEVLEDCDLFFDIISDEDDDEDIEFESIMIRKPGDANGDDKVDAADIVEMVNAKEGKPTSENFSLLNADINEDGEGEVDQNDIDIVVDMIMDYELK